MEKEAEGYITSFLWSWIPLLFLFCFAEGRGQVFPLPIRPEHHGPIRPPKSRLTSHHSPSKESEGTPYCLLNQSCLLCLTCIDSQNSVLPIRSSIISFLPAAQLPHCFLHRPRFPYFCAFVLLLNCRGTRCSSGVVTTLVLSFLFIKLFVYLAVFGLSCHMWDLSLGVHRLSSCGTWCVGLAAPWHVSS